MVEDGWTPIKSEAENVEEKLSIEEVFLLVDINKSGFVSKTVENIFNFLFSRSSDLTTTNVSPSVRPSVSYQFVKLYRIDYNSLYTPGWKYF